MLEYIYYGILTFCRNTYIYILEDVGLDELFH